MDIAKRLKIEQRHLANRILELKKINQVSQKELANNSMLSARVVRRMEKAEANSEFNTIIKVAIGFKIETFYLFDYKNKFANASIIANSLNIEKRIVFEKKKVGKRIFQLCKHRRITQEELGVLSKIANSDISLYINGEENLVLLTLLKIAIGLEVEIIDLFNYDSTMPNNKTFKGKIQF